ncbi:hypothetical protein [Methanosarcina sp. MSH10X1]|uniref:hypothetical protein n=1 Tax=Methanosarcina sp. MSH10X1 TaxID=2507075 RepID=UPI0013E3326A|nr:hypothetical protein [Methanosarcina sp. MSH10X1]
MSGCNSRIPLREPGFLPELRLGRTLLFSFRSTGECMKKFQDNPEKYLSFHAKEARV